MRSTQIIVDAHVDMLMFIVIAEAIANVIAIAATGPVVQLLLVLLLVLLSGFCCRLLLSFEIYCG